jgi:hypothetical protein
MSRWSYDRPGAAQSLAIREPVSRQPAPAGLAAASAARGGVDVVVHAARQRIRAAIEAVFEILFNIAVTLSVQATGTADAQAARPMASVRGIMIQATQRVERIQS